MTHSLVLFLGLVCALAAAGEYQIDRASIGIDFEHEAVLRLQYELSCKESPSFKGALGKLDLGGRTLRLELPAGTKITQVHLGRVSQLPSTFILTLHDSSTCRPSKLDWDFLDATGNLVLEHSPILNIRENQYDNRETDLPLAMGYSIHPSQDDEYFSIRYTFFFSDEDSLTKKTQLDGQMARYGRRTDIEWVYEVGFRKSDNQVMSRKYHSTLFGTVGHSTADYTGGFQNKHPLLFTLTDNNVFTDKPKGKQITDPVAYHLVPLMELPKPAARETLMLSHPWLFLQSDWESSRENKLTQGFQDYLFVRVRGRLAKGSFVGVVTLSEGGSFESGGGNGNVDRLGEDNRSRLFL